MNTSNACKEEVKKMNQDHGLPKNDRIDPEAVPAINCADLRRMGIEERLSLRDRAIYEFLLSYGCRRSELTGLDIEDVE
jgi:site-specific recombinase XerC